MKHLFIITILFIAFSSCSSSKHIEKASNAGDYDRAINDALQKLATNKDKKRKQDYIVSLKNAYDKAVERDIRTIDQLKSDGNPELLKRIHDHYLVLNKRQEAIRPLLPLTVNDQIVSFAFNDYSSEILHSKNTTSTYLYQNALKLLERTNKVNAREAYNTLEYIEAINPNYKDVRHLMEIAHHNGTEYVYFFIENQTDQIIPEKLNKDLLDFDAYGLNNFWTVYHTSKDSSINYGFETSMQLKEINISPERIHEKQLLREKQVIDGWEYQYDANGNVAKDSLGNDIKIDRIINAKCRLYEFNQFKSTQVIANVVYRNLSNQEIIDSFVLNSEFIFENRYATIYGDERALRKSDKRLLKQIPVQFPNDEQMVYDTGEDIKRQLKSIIHRMSLPL